MRIVPHPAHSSTTTNVTSHSKTTPSESISRGAPSAPGLHDTLRSSLTPANASQDSSTHPLEARLSSWSRTQEQLQHTMLRRNYGIAEPLRRGMELKLVRDADTFRPSVLGKASGVHEEILMGRDTEISWEDVYSGQDGAKMVESHGGEGKQGVVGWHEEMEGKVGMGKW